MTAVIMAFVGKWAGWAVGGLVAVLAVFFTGKRAAQQKAAIRDLQEYKKTRKAMDDVQIDDDIGVLRDGLRTRDPDKR